MQTFNQAHDHVNRNDHVNDNDNDKHERGGKSITPAPAGGVLTSTSVAALKVALNGVDTTSVGGGSGKPLLLFKSRENGTWMHGQRCTIVEDASRWAVNPHTFMRGYVCFGDGNKKLGERMLPVSEPMPDITKLPDLGFKWQEQWSVNLKCLDGADTGVEVVFKTTTTGGIPVVTGLIDVVRDRLNGGQHDDKVVPIVHLEKDSYQHGQYGRVWTPLLPIVDWMALSGPAPAPAPTSPPPSAPASSAEQPRRRRVVA